ncbi:unnamed protein product, partial [marine sediment metagenome]
PLIVLISSFKDLISVIEVLSLGWIEISVKLFPLCRSR